MNSQVTKLSGGQQQRLSLVLALVGRPSLVFLDELTTGLDPVARAASGSGLRRRNDDGLTILLTSHHMDEVEYLCDRVAMMVRGRFVAVDSVAGLIRDHIGRPTGWSPRTSAATARARRVGEHSAPG